jgi:hypothetical protein
MASLSEERVVIRLKNDGNALITVVLEPWANEYDLNPRASFDIVETGGRADQQIELHIRASRTTFFAREGGVMSVFRDGEELP